MNELRIVVQTIDDKLGQDMQVYNVSSINPFCEYFVVCTAKNNRQMQAIATGLRKVALDFRLTLKHIEGQQSNEWVLVDFGNIIVHIFNEDSRIHYGFDKLWSDTQKIPLDELLK